MSEQYPPDPFRRPSDPRQSPLFATKPSQAFDPAPVPPPKRQQQSGRPTISARREIRLKRSQLKRNALIILAVVIGLLLALIATDTLKLGKGPQPSLSSKAQPLNVFRAGDTQVKGEQLVNIRKPTHDNPLRVYVGGDSLTGSYGLNLATDLGNTGVIKAAYDSRVSSGLVNTDFFDWNKHIKQMLVQYKPEIITFMIGTNDASIVSANPRSYVANYSKKLNDFLDIVSPADRQVFFVLAPAMRDSKLNQNVAKLNDVITSVATSRNVGVIDAGDVLSPKGYWQSSIKVGSKYKSIRTDDGVHITGDGGKLLAKLIETAFQSKFGLSRYFDDEIIKPIKVSGCCKSPFKATTGSTLPPGTTTSSSTTSSSPSTSSSAITTVPSSAPSGE
jgi:hypothetical protein